MKWFSHFEYALTISFNGLLAVLTILTIAIICGRKKKEKSPPPTQRKFMVLDERYEANVSEKDEKNKEWSQHSPKKSKLKNRAESKESYRDTGGKIRSGEIKKHKSYETKFEGDGVKRSRRVTVSVTGEKKNKLRSQPTPQKAPLAAAKPPLALATFPKKPLFVEAPPAPKTIVGGVEEKNKIENNKVLVENPFVSEVSDEYPTADEKEDAKEAKEKKAKTQGGGEKEDGKTNAKSPNTKTLDAGKKSPQKTRGSKSPNAPKKSPKKAKSKTTEEQQTDQSLQSRTPNKVNTVTTDDQTSPHSPAQKKQPLQSTQEPSAIKK